MINDQEDYTQNPIVKVKKGRRSGGGRRGSSGRGRRSGRPTTKRRTRRSSRR